MDNQSVLSDAILAKELLEEFSESFSDQAPAMERDIATLKATPDDIRTIANLFRTAHNIKGDASLCKISVAVRVVHPIETVLARLRKGEIPFSDVVAETILLAIDRLELAIDDLLHGRSYEHLQIDSLVVGLELMANAPVDEMNVYASSVIEEVTGFRPIAHASSLLGEAEIAPKRAQSKAVYDDLEFFRSLVNQLELRSPLFKGRTNRLLRLASETNKERGFIVDSEQLEAAIYMHDVGMMFLSESIWLKLGQMSDEERYILRTHPQYAYGIMVRMPIWQEAAVMVAQHHEMPDGRGYPNRLKAEQICDGAKILSIVDAFESVMLKHASRGKSRSVLRAIAEINACDNQFAPEWIVPFNQVIRRIADD